MRRDIAELLRKQPRPGYQPENPPTLLDHAIAREVADAEHMRQNGWHWTLDWAVQFIRSEQDWVMSQGYYIALAGGVLNKGVGKDLDLELLPRWEMDPVPDLFIAEWALRLQEPRPVPKSTPNGLHIGFPAIWLEAQIIQKCRSRLPSMTPPQG